ncbi:MAG: hypothetical protein MMC23_006699 [Stictis urceolatum]|nr:hypothetical protein [Stictis urceolata]
MSAVATKASSQVTNQPYDEPDPNTHSQYQRDIYSSFKPPKFSTKPSEWEALARNKVPTPNFGYVFGAASSGRTRAFNTQAFDRYRLKPRMLVNATKRDTSVELFSKRYESPLLAAPIGVQNILHPEAEEATARACRELRVPCILSTAATRSLEQVAAANGDGDRWFQLYWPKPQFEEVTASLLERAKVAGYKVLVVTLDTFHLAWRPTDLDESYLPFVWGDGCQMGHSDPVFLKRYQEMQEQDNRGAGEKLAELWSLLTRSRSPVTAAKILWNIKKIQKSRAWLDVLNSGTFRQWHHLEVLKKLWDGPIVLKGIQTVEDAHKAIEYGMSGIIVSNHGGRQLDGAIASLDALAAIGADDRVKSSAITVLFDSGIRTGSDVLKALALGAKAVLIGRPYVYGLAFGGEEGVKHVFRCILADTDNMLSNLGKKSLRDLCRGDLQIWERTNL